MSIKINQIAGGNVSPKDDAIMYELFLGKQTGIITGVDITSLGANQLKISAGWGMCQGRQFIIEEENVLATLSSSGTIKGRLLVHIDLSADLPITFLTQAAAVLPDLIKEDINTNGSIYQIELATYNVSEISIHDLVKTNNIVKSTKELAEAAQNTANAAMPKTGGTFTGKAYTHLAIEDAAQLANKAYVDGQISSLNGKKTEIQRVWANASPSSPFPAQTFTNIVAGATMVIIRFWCTTSCTVTTTCFLLAGQTVACAVNGALNTWRQVQVGDGHIFFGGGYGYVTYGNATPSASDIYAIPLDIYTVKYTY